MKSLHKTLVEHELDLKEFLREIVKAHVTFPSECFQITRKSMNKAQVMFSRGNPDHQGKNLYFYSCTKFLLELLKQNCLENFQKYLAQASIFHFRPFCQNQRHQHTIEHTHSMLQIQINCFKII